MHISDLKTDPNNANKGTERGQQALQQSLEQYGAGRSILIDKNGYIIAGNKTAEQAGQLGINDVKVVEVDGNTLVAVKRTDLDIDDETARQMAYADNRVGQLSLEWDAEQLIADAEHMDIPFFTDDELAVLLDMPVNGEGNGEPRQTLQERFGAPPFSILDARQGYWQERKRAWIGLGIQSEIGRGSNLGDMSATVAGITDASERDAWNKHRLELPKKTLGAIASNQETLLSPEYKKQDNGLLGFSQQARSHYKGVTGGSMFPSSQIGEDGHFARADLHIGVSEQTGTSIFDPVLCELMYKWYCPPDGIIIDPFAGGSVRGIVAAQLERQYVGIDLSKQQVGANIEQAQAICSQGQPQPVWHVGDSKDIGKLANGQYDFMFSCPPYADLEVYSDDPKDLSTMEYDDFITAYRDIIDKTAAMLRPDRFACFTVGDLRNKQGHMSNFVSHTIQAFEDVGLALYNEAILVTAIGSLPIRAGRPFTSSRKLGKTHQNVLIFIKGDAKKAVAALGAVDDYEGDTAYDG